MIFGIGWSEFLLITLIALIFCDYNDFIAIIRSIKSFVSEIINFKDSLSKELEHIIDDDENDDTVNINKDNIVHSKKNTIIGDDGFLYEAFDLKRYIARGL